MVAHNPQYTTVDPVRKLANSPRTQDVSNTSISNLINSACDTVDEICHRVGNQFTMNEVFSELIEWNTRRIAASYIIAHFNTYGNIELSYQEAQVLYDAAVKELKEEFLEGQTGPELDEGIITVVNPYETTEAALDEGNTEPPVHRSTNYIFGATQDMIQEPNYEKRYRGL